MQEVMMRNSSNNVNMSKSGWEGEVDMKSSFNTEVFSDQVPKAESKFRALENFLVNTMAQSVIKEDFQRVLKKYSYLVDNFPDIAETLLLWIPYVKEQIEDAAKSIRTTYDGVYYYTNQELYGIEFRSLPSKQAESINYDSKSMSLAIITSDAFREAHQELFQNLSELAATFHAVRKTLSKLGSYRIYEYLLETSVLHNLKLSPSSLVLSLVHLYMKHSKNFERRFLRPASLSLSFEDVRNGNGSMYAYDIAGMVVPVPIVFNSILPDKNTMLKELGKIVSSIKTNERILETFMNFVETAEKEIDNFETNLSSEEIMMQAKYVPNSDDQFLANLMADEKEEKKMAILKENEGVMEKMNEIVIIGQGNLENEFEQLEKVPEPSVKTTEAKKAVNQITITVEFFKDVYQSFKTWKPMYTKESISQLLNLPEDILLSILLTERKRRLSGIALQVKATKFIATAMKYKLLPNATVTGSEQLSIKLHKEWRALLERHVEIPMENVRILIKKGERLQKSLDSEGFQNYNLTEIKKIVEKGNMQGDNLAALLNSSVSMQEKNGLITARIEEVVERSFSQTSVLQDLFVKTSNLTMQEVQRFSTLLEKNSTLYSQWTSAIEIGLQRNLAQLSQNVKESNQEIIDEFKGTMQSLEERLNVKFTEIQNAISKVGKAIDAIIGELSNISIKITEIKLKIDRIESQVSENVKFARETNEAIKEFLEEIQYQGMDYIFKKNNNLYQKLNESGKRLDDFATKSAETASNLQSFFNAIPATSNVVDSLNSVKELMINVNNEKVKGASKSLSELYNEMQRIQGIKIPDLSKTQEKIEGVKAGIDSISTSNILNLQTNVDNLSKITQNKAKEMEKAQLSGLEELRQRYQGVGAEMEVTNKKINEEMNVLAANLQKNIKQIENSIANGGKEVMQTYIPGLLDSMKNLIQNFRIESAKILDEKIDFNQLSLREEFETLRKEISEELKTFKNIQGGGGGDGNGGENSGIIRELKGKIARKEQDIAILIDAIEMVSSLVKQQFQVETKWIMGFVGEQYDEERIDEAEAQQLVKQLSDRYQQMLSKIDNTMSTNYIDKDKILSTDAKINYKRKYDNLLKTKSEVFDWQSMSGKKLKFS